MKVRLSEIKVGKRIRKEIGNLDSLKKSIEKHGIINPIVVNKDLELLAGFRRLTAAQELGLTEVDVYILETERPLDMLEIEIEENIVRKDFTPGEILEGLEKKKKLLKPNIFVRIWNFIKRIFGIK